MSDNSDKNTEINTTLTDPILTSALFQELIPYSQSPSEAKIIIEDVIRTEEGGWELVDNKWDAGGWTYAGLTHTTLNAYLPNLQKTDFSRINIGKLPYISSVVVAIYYKEFYLPLEKLLWTEQKGDPSLFAAVYSCAVNLGIPECNKIINQAHEYKPKTFAWQLPSTVTSVPPKAAFITCWMDHYIKLVQAEPSKVVELDGAIHRVLKYCFL